MDEASINTVREEFANDLYKLIVQHMEEINRMLDEFEDLQIATAVQLDAYEAEHRQQEGDLEQPEDEDNKNEQSGSLVLVHESQQEEAISTQQPTSEHQERAAFVNTEEEELNLFDIMEEEVSDKGEEDLTKEEHVDLMGEEDME